MNVLHILNVADWALIGAGLAAALLMMIVGAGGEQRTDRTGTNFTERRRRDP